uniref:FAS-associated factor 2-like n=1 Tax=Petromyzon marinus TaxID=7757 RepID=A0AAJ7WKL9_PETMA
MQDADRAAGEEEAEGALTPEQTEKLLQFQDLTGMESMEQCRRTLQQHQWNIEAAVQDRLNEQEGVPRVFDPPPPPPRPPPTPQTHPADPRVYSYVVRASTPR